VLQKSILVDGRGFALYLFTADSQARTRTSRPAGQAFYGLWFVLSPKGEQITH